jgi:large subunit ribosomal protein L44
LAIPVPCLTQGIHAASEFVHANFLSRHLDVASLLNFRNPKHVLAVEIRKLMAEAGMRDDAAIETRWVWQW